MPLANICLTSMESKWCVPSVCAALLDDTFCYSVSVLFHHRTDAQCSGGRVGIRLRRDVRHVGLFAFRRISRCANWPFCLFVFETPLARYRFTLLMQSLSDGIVSLHVTCQLGSVIYGAYRVGRPTWPYKSPRSVPFPLNSLLGISGRVNAIRMVRSTHYTNTLPICFASRLVCGVYVVHYTILIISKRDN